MNNQNGFATITIVLIIVGALLVGGGIGTGVYYYQKNTAPASTTTNTPPSTTTNSTSPTQSTDSTTTLKNAASTPSATNSPTESPEGDLVQPTPQTGGKEPARPQSV